MAQYLPLGIYAYNPNGNDSAAEAQFDSSANQVSSVTGQPLQFIDAFVDFSGGWSGIVASAAWSAWSQKQSPVANSLTPVVAVPLATYSDNGIGTLQAIASGAHDDVYRGVAQAYRDAGFSTVDIRIGWEMDGNYMPWSMGTTPDSVAAWTAAFSHVADVLHSVSGIKVNVVWNPGLSNNNTVDVKQAYPGDSKVDIIGLDIYSHTYKEDPSVSDTQFYDYPGATPSNPTGNPATEWGLSQTMAFAAAHGKPVGIAEAGVAVGDNDALPGAIAAAFNAPGAPQAAFVNVWDVTTPQGDWKFTDGNDPGAASAWAGAFAGNKANAPAANSGASTSAAPAATSASTTTAAISTATTIPNVAALQFLTPNANRAEAAWGPADVSGDAGADVYVVHPGDGTMVIENFSAGKGDVLAVSSSLQAYLQETQVSGGLQVSFGGDPSGTANTYLKGVTSLDSSAIHWT